jgi:RNA polymerase sigma-70 factor (ECF subfamily)
MDTALTDTEIAHRIHGRSDGVCVAEEAELVRRFAPRVRLYGLRHLRDEEEAEELVQRVLWVVLQRLRAGEVREPDRIASFVLGTARHTVQGLRREGGRMEPAGDGLPETAAPVPPPLEPFRSDALARCLEALGERERSVTVLTFYLDQGADEIARLLGLSTGNVRVIRHRALGRLRGCLAGSAEEVS